MQALNPEIECCIREFSTAGDRLVDQPLPMIGGKGLFTDELDRALKRDEIDIAVHSLKDLPTVGMPGIATVPVLKREDPRDILISRTGCSFRELPAGAVVGTSSYRRQSQLLAIRSDIRIESVRGNVPTRIAKAQSGACDAVVIAAAGVIRLDRTSEISEWISLEDVLPAPGQAALAATCRSDDREILGILERLCDKATLDCVTAERLFLSNLGGGCSSPIAAYAKIQDEISGQIELLGRVVSIDGSRICSGRVVGIDPQELAGQLTELILRSGGKVILDSIQAK